MPRGFGKFRVSVLYQVAMRAKGARRNLSATEGRENGLGLFAKIDTRDDRLPGCSARRGLANQFMRLGQQGFRSWL